MRSPGDLAQREDDAGFGKFEVALSGSGTGRTYFSTHAGGPAE